LSPSTARRFRKALLEAELFGHEKGAFTGAIKQTIGKIESANFGTLFLDEVGDIPMAMQVKAAALPRRSGDRAHWRTPADQDRRRIVCATNQDLPQADQREAVSAKTCSTASTRSPSSFRPCASGMATPLCWRISS
jgi:transcriptional regulator with GAF, ATPase, and Fis domain